jgi:hypothetical protein
MDSMISTFLKEYPFEFWAKSSPDHPSSPISLDTTGLNQFFPGLEAKYGAKVPIDIQFSVLKVDNFDTTKDNEIVTANIDL